MATIDNDQGVVLSIQFLIAGQRAEVVIPCAAQDAIPTDAANAARQIVEAAEIALIPVLVDIMCDSSQIVGLSAEYMLNGGIPYRRNYPLGTYVGTNGENVVPQQVAVLVSYYPDPADVSPGSRTKSGRNFIPGVSEELLSAEVVDAALISLVENLADQLISGFAGSLGTPSWQRVLRADRAVGATLRFCVSYVVRSYVGTIRRRLLPHS